jgi:hypothetical protein
MINEIRGHNRLSTQNVKHKSLYIIVKHILPFLFTHTMGMPRTE